MGTMLCSATEVASAISDGGSIGGEGQIGLPTFNLIYRETKIAL